MCRSAHCVGKGSSYSLMQRICMHLSLCTFTCTVRCTCTCVDSTSSLFLHTADEKALVEEVFTNAIDCLSDDDKKLPQVEHVLPLLKRGIGIHHSGLLPILKETTEILFQEGLIKVAVCVQCTCMLGRVRVCVCVWMGG